VLVALVVVGEAAAASILGAPTLWKGKK